MRPFRICLVVASSILAASLESAGDGLDPAVWGGIHIDVVKTEVSRGPRLVRAVCPLFPNVHRQPHYLVVLDAIVGTDGRVRHLVPSRREDALFVDAAKNAVEQWVFDPATLRGVPVPCQVSISIPFKLVTRERAPARFSAPHSP